MSPMLHHECTRVPVTALASCGTLLVTADGPFLRFYRAKDFEYVASRRVFKAQSVHGISVYAEEHNQSHVTKLVVWGGRLVRALEVISSGLDFGDLDVHLSVVARAPDWILDLTPRPIDLEDEAVYHAGTCVAVTAHNALLQVDIERGENRSSSFEVHVKELTSSSRSILYSAHVFFESQQCILIAAGTAFGEIIFWSASYSTEDKFVSQIHRVFLGHEGSIFGVRISKELPSDCCQKLKRVIASCSDDRTIRIWDVSEIDFTGAQLIQETHSSQREHHTGFSNEAFDTTPSSSSACLAIGWGHSSRVWKVHFLDSMPCDGSLVLLSAGEDATLRTWRMKPSIEQKSSFQYTLHEKDCAAYHSGKNIWSFAVQSASRQQQHVVCGAADAKITASTLRIRTAPYEPSPAFKVHEYTVTDMLSRLPGNLSPDGVGSCDKQKSSKKTEFFRSYCALSQGNFLLTTNLGRVLAISLDQTGSIDTAELIEKRDDLSGYSLCASDRTGDYAFVAGAGGAIYTYSSDTRTITEVTMVEGKVGDLFVSKPAAFVNRKYVVLLTTLMGQKRAELHYLRTDSGQGFSIGPRIMVPVSEASTGSVVTSMAHVAGSELDFLILGFRRGSIALYSISNDSSNSVEAATMFRVIEGVHGEETVTALYWISTPETGSTGHLLSVGRDGQLAIHAINLLGNSVVLVHDLTLPFGPNVEGIYSHGADILVHGFSNKKWVLYNIKTEEEIMAVETGGGHRSWAFQQNPGSVGGTLIWTRASSMHIYSRTLPSHEVVRAGGHGREIKAVAISPNKTRPLIATGSEDTDIKIFEYVEGDLRCRKTLRKHTTGIQHLQWSHDGNYLFSSGGCEELYVWRIRHLPAFMDIGVVCEHAYISESEYADLRIMSFDAKELDASYIISVVFSDSSLKIYKYSPGEAPRWQSLAKGVYFTSCLTQCLFLSDDSILTAGTDGHAVVWHLPAAGTSDSTIDLKWQQPTRIHQSSSKSMSSQLLNNKNLLIVSGGDDATLAFLIARTESSIADKWTESNDIRSTTIVTRTHASAVTACAMIQHGAHTYVLTSGNDQWIRLWEVDVFKQNEEKREETIAVTRICKVKTSVADVSSMDILSMPDGENAARMLICGVGMEVIRVEFGPISADSTVDE